MSARVKPTHGLCGNHQACDLLDVSDIQREIPPKKHKFTQL